jgi:hypothetical protein
LIIKIKSPPNKQASNKPATKYTRNGVFGGFSVSKITVLFYPVAISPFISLCLFLFSEKYLTLQ